MLSAIKLNTQISSDFSDKVDRFCDFLSELRKECNEFDNKHSKRDSRVSYVLERKNEIFPIFDNFFVKIWEYIKSLDKKSYETYQSYYQLKLKDPLLKTEINQYIKEKPLGYPGDYVMMNYIYDYHDDFLGKSSLEMLINYYTTNIPISCSNIKRKEYFKRKIMEILAEYDHPRVTSVGCGPARELLELVEEGRINKPFTYCCVDFEKEALGYIREKLSKIDRDRKQNLSVKYIQVDIRDLLKDEKLYSKIGQQDFIYASGILDYLGKHLAKRIIGILFKMLYDSGLLIVVNAGLKDSGFRSYYELLGEWHFFHRSQDEMLEWVEPLKPFAYFEFEQFSFPMTYLFLKTTKIKK